MTDVDEMSTLGNSASKDLSFPAEATAGTAAIRATDTFMVDVDYEGVFVLIMELCGVHHSLDWIGVGDRCDGGGGKSNSPIP